MNAIEILNEWLRYSKYDPEQKKFNLMSNDYYFHRCNENIGAISEYDPTGTLAVLYTKEVFMRSIRDKSVRLFDVLSNPSLWAEEKRMWDIFNSPDIKAVEYGLLDNVGAIVEQVVETKMIGERDKDAEKAALFESITSVVEQLSKCNVDLFLRGGNIKPVTRFSTHIHVFELLSECLLAIEAAQDGIYLCYINNGGSADGYFGFYIKSNGNILSINERVNEAYPGQHKRSRNGRWTEDKKFELFPYNYIFSFSDYDYKGYATKHMIEEDKLAFCNLEPGAYMPLILAMIMLNTKYSGANTAEMPIKYVDSLLRVNIERPLETTKALIIPEQSAVAAVNRNLEINMSADGIKNADYAKNYDHSLTKGVAHYTEVGHFPDKENIFVTLYGDGFEVDAYSLLEANTHLKRLNDPTQTEELPDAEFVGSERRMGMIAYQRARAQLAGYIRDRMFEEYKSFGGVEAIGKWWKDILKEKQEEIIALCVAKYNAIQNGTDKNLHKLPGDDSTASPFKRIDDLNQPLNDEKKMDYLSFQENCNGTVRSYYTTYRTPLNPVYDYDKYGRPGFKAACIKTGALSSIFFTFDITNWREIEEIVGAENMPKILKGYCEGHRGAGNSLLNAADPVWTIGTPFEKGEHDANKRYWTKSQWKDHYFHAHDPDWHKKEPPKDALEKPSTFDFDFAIGFSKRGWAQILKEHENKK